MNIKQIIELVEKWIADPKSVSQRELRAACDAAYDAAYTARGAAYRDAWFAVRAAYSVLNGDIDDAKLWVADYHKSLND